MYDQFAPNADPANTYVWNEGFFDGPNGPHSSFSSGIMTVNSSYNGSIGYFGDSDWIRIDFQQGKTYTIQMYSVYMESFLALADNTGNVLTNDNFEIKSYLGYNYYVAELTVTASRTGTYYVIAEESGHNGTGGYTVDVTETVTQPTTPTVWTYDQIAHRLTDSGWAFFNGVRREWDKKTITFNDSGLNATAQKLVDHAFDAWEKITGLTFTRTAGIADIVIDDNDPDKAYANSTIKTNGSIGSANINISPGFGGIGAGTLDSYEFQTFIHEIGHAIGLAHAGDYNAGSGGPTTYPDSVQFKNDSWNATIMSYINQRMNTEDGADYALIMTPMIGDIVAVHDLYGVPVSAYNGNTRYGFNSNTGDYMDLVFDALVKKDFSSPLIDGGRTLSFTLWDTGGRDVVDFRTDKVKQVINLGFESQSTIYGVAGSMMIGRDTVIENVVAGRKADKVTGNAAGNVLDGRNGNDVLKGLAGKDVLKGGNGADKMFGGVGNDTLNGGTGNDILTGQKGKDTFVFAKNFDKDTITDFRNNQDTLRLDDNLWTGTKTKAQVISQFGDMVGGNAVFDFGGGDVLTIKGFNLNQLADDLVIV
ncbi:MAG: M10 family metallopeptidase [Pseudooceanicola sp.]|nr:M10 family metallopeptidase [Pseudooceanicola sp.]